MVQRSGVRLQVPANKPSDDACPALRLGCRGGADGTDDGVQIVGDDDRTLAWYGLRESLTAGRHSTDATQTRSVRSLFDDPNLVSFMPTSPSSAVVLSPVVAAVKGAYGPGHDLAKSRWTWVSFCEPSPGLLTGPQESPDRFCG